MLYLDSSALVKCYVREAGSKAVLARLHSGERIFTAVLSYFEVFAALGRKLGDRALEAADFERAREDFLYDWQNSLSRIAVDARLMSGLEALIRRHPLRGADAVHLCAALWLRDSGGAGPEPAGTGAELEFGVADRKLRRAAEKCGLIVFDPEEISGG